MPPSQPDDYFAPEQAREWLRNEIHGVTKAAQLRLQEASELVNDYLSGKLTTEEAKNKLLFQYEARWGDSPIEGVPLDANMSDKRIIELRDEYRKKELQRRQKDRENHEREGLSGRGR